ncbi:Gfo/Idh/MocA family protein [Bosea sp. NBC_00550]|uniref:Gfo/Idh/MocA family protein n=1 Tax=Bosea sp. NBC_00550 TaxID=2969621 RepID=UPI002230518E|nr:Gfo/Idh/MocA family oxidoreductase [Bosea sp. NBC_00550]UZF95506.1 Gfo/Idh/MocA family oxidoreductase [Bosea sp. NBC_00550]
MVDIAESVRTAFVGTGWWGSELGEAANRTRGHIEVVLGCGLDDAERASFGRRFGCPVTQDFADVLSDPAVEAIVLATPHLMHVSQIVAAASAGKHVLVEKPLSTTLVGALTAVEAARSGSIVLAVGHNRRLLAQVDLLKELVESGTLGRLLHVEANFSTAEAMAFSPGHWRTSPEECPGGAMTVLGVHVIDWLHHLFGPISEVAAHFSHRGTRVPMDDVSTARLAFSNGLSASLVCLYSAPYTNRFVIHGSEATVSVVGIRPDSKEDRPSFTIVHKSGEMENRPIPFIDTLALQLERFAHAIRGNGAPAVSGVQGACNVAVLDAIVGSARAGGRTQCVSYGPFHVENATIVP